MAIRKGKPVGWGQGRQKRAARVTLLTTGLAGKSFAIIERKL